LLLVAKRRILRRQRQWSTAGFVLPTVTMVMLVVVLLTVAIMLRSFESSETARYLRLNEAALASGAGPGLERGIAKLREAEGTSETTLTEVELNEELETSKYTLPGETRLTIAYDIPDVDAGGSEIYNQETIKTAWKFPVDTDGNGKYDSFNVYGIFHRTPKLSNDELIFDRQRNPLDATTAPQPELSAVKDGCPQTLAVSRATVGTADWYKAGATLKKSFFIYSAIVPLSEDTDLTTAGLNTTDYEAKEGSTTFAALQLQEDRERVPLSNNAAVYEDDLQITPGGGIKINGRIFTNGSLLTGRRSGDIDYFLVSSPNSCFYQMENSKIVVGGNVGLGPSDRSTDLGSVNVDLFDLAAEGSSDITRVTLDSSNKPVTSVPNQIAGDDKRYVERISSLVTSWIDATESTLETEGYHADDPEEVKRKVVSDSESAQQEERYAALETYFKARTRRVPVAESSFEEDALTYSGTGDAPNPLRPPNKAIYPYDPSDGSSNNGLELNLSGSNLNPPATQPELVLERGKEERLGDRLLIGNGLPAKWYDVDTDRFSTFIKAQNVKIGADNSAVWNEAEEGEETRTRRTRMQPIGDLDPVRNGFWEKKAAAQPDFLFSGVGGIRVITGAGVYERKNSFLPPPPDLNDATPFAPTGNFVFTGSPPANTPPDYDDKDTGDEERLRLVWEDSMPMSPLGLVDVADTSEPYVVKGYDNWDDGLTEWGTTGTANISDLLALREQDALTTTEKAETIDPDTNKYTKGDLRMRATVVYMYNKEHYDDAEPTDYQAPQACISAYYDPTNYITAKNKNGLPWNADTNGKSNNGIVYPAPTETADSLGAIPTLNSTTGLFAADEYVSSEYDSLEEKVAYQANLVFPSGRFVNETLREALIAKQKGDNLTLPQQAAIDSTICSLQILDGTISPVPTADALIPHGAIKEVTITDARQLRAIEGPDGEDGTYDLPVEERQPLEIRLTQLDLDAMRKQSIGNMSIKNAPSSQKEEFLLPNSGVVYATRDDALPDLSANPQKYTDPLERQSQSTVDFVLDPTRRPSGIMLINGSKLARKDDTNVYEGREAERGLILASNLPVYVQADDKGFNLHQTPSGATLEEFTEQIMGDTWSPTVFYDRDTIDTDFACRKGDPRFPDCDPGDLWRPATVISDAVSLLSNEFRPGYRVEVGYDLRNNTNIRESYFEDDLGNKLGVVGVIRGAAGPGYDLNGDGSISNAASITEQDFNIDLNGDGTVSGSSSQVAEEDITAAAAYRLMRLKNGFYENNYATSYKWFQNNGYPNSFSDGSFDGSGGNKYSSYFSNFVTPIQRRQSFPTYLMEMCMKLPVSECEPDDWFVGIKLDSTPKIIRAVEGTGDEEIDLGNVVFDRDDATSPNDNRAHIAGTTLQPAFAPWSGTTLELAPSWFDNELRTFPRRVAFLRDASGDLDVSSGNPVPLGTYKDGSNPEVIDKFPYSSYPNGSDGKPIYTRTDRQHTLWFRTTSDTTNPDNETSSTWTYNADNPLFLADTLLTENPVQTTFGTTAQPLLVPVLQFITPTGTPGTTLSINGYSKDKDWFQQANNSTFNLVVGSGDVPTRASVDGISGSAEPNGGLPNFPRYLEYWSGNNSQIGGSFIQFKRSSYATGPFTPVVSNSDNTYYSNLSRFGYTLPAAPHGPYRNQSQGKQPFYIPPNRVYGFDPGLLYQFPDLFGATFTQPSTKLPQNFLRDVSRDNDWVKAMLCAAQDSEEAADNGYESADALYGSGLKYAIPESQRPENSDGSKCPVKLD
jgi:hypothetical protein